MPLGVEHSQETSRVTLEKKVSQPLMPLGVEHLLCQSLALLPLVSQPLMPLGVEHLAIFSSIASRRVSQPLMPLGVEHRKSQVKFSCKFVVSQPLMPLGVEHMGLAIMPVRSHCESTFDAVRR